MLRWAVHEPELVADWLDARLFADPIAARAFERVASADSIHDAIDAERRQVRDLLERLAVEEPIGRRRARDVARAT